MSYEAKIIKLSENYQFGIACCGDVTSNFSGEFKERPCTPLAVKKFNSRRDKVIFYQYLSLTFKTWRPRYMPVFKSMWCGLCSSPVSGFST